MAATRRRTDYSPIIDRPAIRWPNNARVGTDKLTLEVRPSLLRGAQNESPRPLDLKLLQVWRNNQVCLGNSLHIFDVKAGGDLT
jgi:hypothetical protein